MRRSLLHFFFVFSFVILFSCYFPVLGHAQTSPSLDFTVVPSQNEYAKPPNEDAKGRLDITITPKGKIDNIVRPPIDVVFVFDISGSMDELGTDPMKFQSAKQALASSIHYFKANANPSDRFALVPFSDGVKYDRVVPFPSGVYNVSSHLETILETANGLVAGGGTNYLAALQMAQSFFDDSTRKKYVIFLTDGEPTVSKVKKKVTYNNQTANLDVEPESVMVGNQL
ncbi:VWA domain-containing protein [Anoxybacillus flavithermus]|uniref:VWA domain-containing protein n=1 Tax=Anoxybacillus flavithermus TaxID=33934 RepID=UPI001866F13D|nr:VWA domain-containing protein [Anoxybacillus flavithermus]